jgi:hypothetical protein
LLDGVRERERERTRLVAWQVATTINLWSKDQVSVAELMGEESRDDLLNDVDGILAEADEMQARRDAKQIEAEAGWDDVIPAVPEDQQ